MSSMFLNGPAWKAIPTSSPQADAAILESFKDHDIKKRYSTMGAIYVVTDAVESMFNNESKDLGTQFLTRCDRPSDAAGCRIWADFDKEQYLERIVEATDEFLNTFEAGR